jgi:hypothetical protein
MKRPLPIKFLCLLAALHCHPLAGTATAAPEPSIAPAESAAPAERPRVVVIKPVILCDDDGTHPARTAFPKTKVDQVYTRANLEFLYLEPAPWRNGPARRGEINLDEIVKQGRANGMIAADRRVVTLLFVSAVDGNPRMLGRGLQNGNVCFVSLGADPSLDDAAKQAFVVAHEIGHCLGLRHAVDDPAVPDDVPNLQGDGPFDQRLSTTGLHPTQAETVLKSPLVIDRVKCYNTAEAQTALTDESWFPYLTSVTPDMLRFTLGLPADAPIPQEPAARLAFARERQAAMAAEFTADEEAALRRAVAGIVRKIGGDWPMLCRLPWHFVKVKPGFCHDLPHTRGVVTVLSASAAAHLARNEAAAEELLIHEKIHVVQRLNPDRFTALYQKYGYAPLRLAPGEAERLNLIQNPDAPVSDWAVSLGDDAVLIATAFNRQLGFAESYYHLVSLPDGTSRIGDKLADPDAMETWRERFPVRIGYDHPHEAFAYLCGGFLTSDEPPVPSDNAITKLTLKELPRIFALEGN